MKNDRNPYNGFKDDHLRYRALRDRVIGFTVAVIAVSWSGEAREIVGVVRAMASAIRWW